MLPPLFIMGFAIENKQSYMLLQYMYMAIWRQQTYFTAPFENGLRHLYYPKRD